MYGDSTTNSSWELEDRLRPFRIRWSMKLARRGLLCSMQKLEIAERYSMTVSYLTLPRSDATKYTKFSSIGAGTGSLCEARL